MSTIPITALSPENDPPSDKAIRGVVTLFWPYSSSTRQCAFLLADPDFRLRNKQGQVRVRFTGASAEAVAKSRVGIGDEVVLSLDGGSWEDDPEATRTPGKSVGGELCFRRKLQLQVVSDSGDVQVHVDASLSPPRSKEHDGNAGISTPLPKTTHQLGEIVDGALESAPGYAYTSPAFVKRLKLSNGSLLDSAFDPFVGDNMDIDDGDEWQGTSFGRDIKWRYAVKTPSPTKDVFAVTDQSDQNSTLQTEPHHSRALLEGQDESAEGTSPPPGPELPLSQQTISQPESTVAVDLDEGHPTLKLQSAASPALPVPSPFSTQGVSQSRYDFRAGKEGEDLLIEELSGSPVQQEYNESAVQSPQKGYRPISKQSTLAETDPEEPAAHIIPQPETPKHSPLTTGFGFGLDGATSSTMRQQQVSPQDVEKQRVMAQTFRSLFGFTSSPQKADPVSESTYTPAPVLSQLEKQRLDASDQVAQPMEEVLIESSTTVATNELSATISSLPSIEVHEVSKPQSQPEAEVIEIESSSEEDVDTEAETEAPIKQAPPVQAVSSLRLESPDTTGLYQDSQAQPFTAPQEFDDQLALQELSQDSIGHKPPQPKDESVFESSVEQDRLYPTLPSEEAAQYTSERKVKSMSPEARARPTMITEDQDTIDPSKPIEDVAMVDTNEREDEATSQDRQLGSIDVPFDQSIQQPSYPSLPLSPLHSQTIHEMVPSTLHDIPETIRNMFPPTPQLTQAESSGNLLQEMLTAELPVSQEEPTTEQGLLPDQATENHATLLGLQTGVEALKNEPRSQAPDPLYQVQAEVGPRLIEQESQPARQIQVEVETQETKHTDPGRITRAKAKKAASNRLSIIPDAISPYFSPRQSSGTIPETKAQDEALTVGDVSTNSHVQARAKAHELVNGFSTTLSYFTPLSRLDSLLNTSLSQHAFGGKNTVDVLAVVTKSTEDPFRAKKGPKDHYTIFHITDPSLSPKVTRVEVFRPFKNTLPAAKEGDVVLLRAFAVKSRNHEPYLLSSDASAWCVFTLPLSVEKSKPVWARKAGEEHNAVSEKVSGPPVEFGQEERDRAKHLRAWWEQVRDEKTVTNDGHNDEDNEVNGINGHVSQPVAAKL